MSSKGRLFAKALIESPVISNAVSYVTPGSTIAPSGILSKYDTVDELPLTGNNPADQAYVAETNRLYLWTGTGWYNIALINTSPSITGGNQSSYQFAIDGTPIEITLVGSDPEGIPLTWSYEVTGGSLTNGGGTTATVSNVDNVFTITPSTNEAYSGSFSLTFKASDGVNVATAVSSFVLGFSLDFSDDFSTNTTSNYTIYKESSVSVYYNSGGQTIDFGTGDNLTFIIWYESTSLPLPPVGTFRSVIMKTADWPTDNEVYWVIGKTPVFTGATRDLSYPFAIKYTLSGSQYARVGPTITVDGSVVETSGTLAGADYDDQSSAHTFELYWNNPAKEIKFYIDQSLVSTHTFTTDFQQADGFGIWVNQMGGRLYEWSITEGQPSWIV